MWLDFKIGTGSHGNMAWGNLCPKCGIGVSENSVSYWVSNVFGADYSGVIMKDTPEGRALAEALANGKPGKVVQVIETAAVKRLSPAKLRNVIRDVRRKSFISGKNCIRTQIWKSLSLEDNW